MPKAILKNGVILALEPLPKEWEDGRELCIESVTEDDEEKGFDAWSKELEALVAQNDPTDLARVEIATKHADEQAKAIIRREMGLP